MTTCKSCEYSQRQIEKLQREVESLTKQLELQKALLERESEMLRKYKVVLNNAYEKIAILQDDLENTITNHN